MGGTGDDLIILGSWRDDGDGVVQASELYRVVLAQNDGAGEEASGGNGDDTLYGADGRDSLLGEAGNDVLDGGAGADQINGGSGVDTVSYASSGAAVAANLATGIFHRR